MQTAAAGVRHVAVSLPYVGFLLADQPDKYLRPEDLPPPGKVDFPSRSAGSGCITPTTSTGSEAARMPKGKSPPN